MTRAVVVHSHFGDEGAFAGGTGNHQEIAAGELPGGEQEMGWLVEALIRLGWHSPGLGGEKGGC